MRGIQNKLTFLWSVVDYVLMQISASHPPFYLVVPEQPPVIAFLRCHRNECTALRKFVFDFELNFRWRQNLIKCSSQIWRWMDGMQLRCWQRVYCINDFISFIIRFESLYIRLYEFHEMIFKEDVLCSFMCCGTNFAIFVNHNFSAFSLRNLFLINVKKTSIFHVSNKIFITSRAKFISRNL